MGDKYKKIDGAGPPPGADIELSDRKPTKSDEDAFDMRVLRRLYNDEGRWHTHMRKLHDPMHAVQRAAGRRVSLSAFIRRLNSHYRTVTTGIAC